jgi:transposase-like protein
MQRIDLGERPTRRSDLTRWYSAVLAAQERNGLSVREYARQLGVTATTLYSWRRRLSAGGRRRSARAATETGRPGLVELVVDRSHAGDAGQSTVVRLRGDRRIEVPRGFDGDDLRRLVTVLESC